MSTLQHPHADLSAYVDRALPAAEHVAVEAHVRACAACQARVADLRAVAALVRALPDPVPARRLVPRLAGPRWLAPMRTLASIASGISAFFFVASVIVASAPTSATTAAAPAPQAGRAQAPSAPEAGRADASTPQPAFAFQSAAPAPSRAVIASDAAKQAQGASAAPSATPAVPGATPAGPLEAARATSTKEPRSTLPSPAPVSLSRMPTTGTPPTGPPSYSPFVPQAEGEDFGTPGTSGPSPPSTSAP